jgi:hypothetical protein
MLRMLRAGEYAPDDERDYEDGEEFQLRAAAEEELQLDSYIENWNTVGECATDT